MTSKPEALTQIVALAREHGISVTEITQALPAVSEKPKSTGNTLARVFSYLGGTFILAGVAAYIGMFWDSMGSLAHVLVTFGTGFCCYIMAVVAMRDDHRFHKMVTPLFLLAAFMQPGGLFVAIHEWFDNGGDPRYAGLAVFSIMAVQQFFTFRALRHPVLLFFSVLFGAALAATIMDLLEIPNELTGLCIGFSLLCVAYNIGKTTFHRTAGLWYFIGSVAFLVNLFDVLEGTPLELLFLATSCFFVYVSVWAQSVVLLVVGILSMLSYIGYFTAEHFVNSIGWPISLILLGIIFFAISTGGMKIKRKYIG